MFFSFVLLTACTKVQNVSEETMKFTLDTKAVQAVSSGSTYRILMYNEKDRGYRQSGTYYKKQEVADLIACELGDNGEFLAEDPDKGINGVSDKVYLVLASPGMKCNDDGSFDLVPDAGGDFYLNAPELKTVGGYGPVRLSKPLFDPRSTIGFEFYKKPGIAPFAVKESKVRIIGAQNVNESVKVYPALRQVKMASDNQIREITLEYDSNHTVTPDANGYELFYSTSNPLSVASGIYASKQEAADYLGINLTSNLFDGSYIYMTCFINQGGRDVEIRMPLSDKILELKPQHNYVYRVMVESDYISVVLDVYDSTANDWQAGADISSSIGTLTETLEIGKWTLEGWQPAGNIDYTIG